MPTPENRTMENPAQERRNEARRVFKGARIVFQGRWAAIDCTVRNLSGRGACLKVENPLGIPETFDLVCEHPSFLRKCRVTWRQAMQIGVEFDKVTEGSQLR